MKKKISFFAVHLILFFCFNIFLIYINTQSNISYLWSLIILAFSFIFIFTHFIFKFVLISKNRNIIWITYFRVLTISVATIPLFITINLTTSPIILWCIIPILIVLFIQIIFFIIFWIIDLILKRRKNLTTAST